MSEEIYLPPPARQALLKAIMDPIKRKPELRRRDLSGTTILGRETCPYMPAYRRGAGVPSTRRTLNGRCLAVPPNVIAHVPSSHPLHRHLMVMEAASPQTLTGP